MARTPTFTENVTGPYRVRLGSYPYEFVFDKLDLGVPVWHSYNLGRNYNAHGMCLFLYHMGGRWDVAHGPDHLWNASEVLAAQYSGQLAPVWRSYEDIMQPGPHYWDSYIAATQQWLGEAAAYQTTVTTADLSVSLPQMISVVRLGRSLTATLPQN